jgi:hypothetical protein
MRLYAVVDGDDPGVAIPPKRDSPSPLEDDEGTLDSCETEAVARAEAAPSHSPTGDPVEVGLARTWPFERIPTLAWHGFSVPATAWNSQSV